MFSGWHFAAPADESAALLGEFLMMKYVLSGGFAVGALMLGGLLLSTNQEAAARPQYNKAFHDTYADNKEAAALAANAKCSVCHPAMDKKVRNDYGMSLGKLIGA